MKGIHLFRHFFKEHSYKYIVGIILLLHYMWVKMESGTM